MFTDLRFVWRVVKRNKYAFAAVVALLGIAVGSTIAVLTAMDVLVLHPLPIRYQDRVVSMGGLTPGTPTDPVAWWGQAKALDAIALYSQGQTNVNGAGGKERIEATIVSPAFFRVFGLQPVLGRDFRPRGEDRQAAIISYAFWQSYFGGRRSVLGTSLRINRIPYWVIGVAPQHFEFPPGVEVWLPRQPRTASAKEAPAPEAAETPPATKKAAVGVASANKTAQPLAPPEPVPLITSWGWVGRLHRGVHIDQARDELYALLNRLNGEYSRKTGVIYGQIVGVRPLREKLAANAEPAMRALLVGAILVLLIAAANCSLFLLGRASARRLEMAVRQALGAPRSRVLRQLLSELLALGAAGGVLAFAISAWLLTIIQKLLPAYHVQPSFPLAPTFHTFVYCLLLCIAISLLAGLAPSLQSSAPATLEALKDYSGPLASGRGPLLRRLMVVIEAAVAVVLVIGAILSVRTFVNLIEVDPGYNPRHVFMAHLVFPRSQFNDRQFLARQREVLDDMRAAPGITGVAVSSVLPSEGPTTGQWVRRGNAYKFSLLSLVGGDYFRTMEIPLIAGRLFSDGDHDAVIINQSAARELWQGASPVGDVLMIDGENAPRRVIGIVKDTRGIGLGETTGPQIYLPYRQPYRGKLSNLSAYVLARCGLGRAGCASVVMQRVREAAGGAEIEGYSGLEELVETATGPVRARAALLAFYGLLAAALTWLGVYALVSYLAVVRNYEMGVRMTFGARAGDVVFLLSGEGLVCAGVGVIAGVIAAFGAVKVLSSLLFGVKPLDPATFAVAAFVMFLGAVIACMVPALRVARREPWEILQSR